MDIIRDILINRRCSKEKVDSVRMDLYLSIFRAYIYVGDIDECGVVAIHIVDEYMPLHNFRKATEREKKIEEIFEN